VSTDYQYWLFTWMAKYDVRSLDHAHKLLLQEGPMTDLRAMAESRATTRQASRPLTSVLAGRGIDLSGQLDCNAASCRRRQADDLFHRVWFYFDKIVVADAVAHEITCHWTEPSDRFIKWLLSHIGTLLYLRDLGAEHLVEFHEKPIPCEEHWRRHAEEAGLTQLLRAADEIIPALVSEGAWTFNPRGDGSVDFLLNHPSLEHTQWGSLDSPNASSMDLGKIKIDAAESVVRTFVAHLTSDAVAAQTAGVPLGSTLYMHRRLLRQSGTGPAGNVAFDLQLPVLDNLPTALLIKIRYDESENFRRFQFRLRQAIEEKQKIDGTSEPEKVARQIREDLIEPELQRLRDRLMASERVLNKKTAVGIALGALATTCGIVSGIAPPVALGAGVGTTLAMTGAAASKHIEEVRDISLEDMYFLWQAIKHVHS
jgi:hypothetical protein